MSVQDTLDNRQNVHGDYTDVACYSVETIAVWSRTKNWSKLNHVQRDAIAMIAHKIARILAGDPNHADHWHDIQGYARLAEERLAK